MALGVFISHAHEDRELARSLRQLLASALALAPDDITCTSDADYGLDRGERLMDQIKERLRSAQALFLLATPAARQKEWVNFECGFADAARDRGELEFYVLIPTPSHRDAVPQPYRDRVAVTLSNGADLHAFIGQVRRTFDIPGPNGDSDEYISALLDLEQRALAIEQQAITSGKNAQTTQSYRRLAAAATVGALLFGVAGLVLGHRRGAAQVTEYEAQARESVARVNDLEAQISAQAREADVACEAELKRLPFSGLVHDAGSLRPVPCTKVEALFPDSQTGSDRRVSQDCDSGGTFTFLGEQLLSDPRQPIALEVRVGAKGFRLPIVRSQARLAIPISGGRP